MGKRKRSGEASASETPAPKKQTTENGPTAAEKRQQRSERKSKKSEKPKSNRINGASKEPEQLLPGTNVGDDSFAGGEDFVSLDPAPSASNGATSKVKRKGPRAERKEAKETKAKAETSGEPTTQEIESKPKQKGKKEESSARFIAFVGNLPYSATTAQIAQHFKKLAPAHIRHSTDKDTGKSRGFAFLEFDDYSAMKTCLKVYHHSNFDPERTSRLPADAFDENGLEIGSKDADRRSVTGRRINVELTAGGGGKSSGRKEKIQKKNTKLFEERERRKKEEIKKAVKEGKGKKEKSEANSTEIGSEAVHPSRMRRVPNAQD